MLKFVFPALTSSRHAAIPPPRDEGAFTLLSNFRSPVSGFRSPVSRFSTSYFLISTSQRERLSAFTLLELLVVIAIIAILMVLIAPAFTNMKSANDVTTAAYTIKGVLDQARTYAMANNTYAALGFAGSIGNTPVSVTGQVYVATLGSTDGTANGLANGSYRQLGKLLKFDNAHINDTGVPTNDGTDFESRPNVASSYRISSAAAGAFTITVQGITFSRWIQFSPRGEAVLGGNSAMTQYMEVGLFPTHGTSLAASQDANGKWLGNIVAVQVSGFSGSVRIYRR